MTTINPVLNPIQISHTDQDYSENELTLSNRNSGTLIETLRHDVTPPGAHYLLNHFDVPYVAEAGDWTLSLSGCLENPATLDYQTVTSMPARTQRVTLECAGNGRRYVTPRWPSQPWGYEAVGTSDWHGTSLRHILEQAGITDDCVELVFHGADEGIDAGQVHHFARSLSPEMAMHEDVMVVWQMNNQPLAPQHGFPLRLIVPGWYGMASVKWLSHIQAIDHRFQGYQQVRTYMYRKDRSDTGTPVTCLRVKSLLVPPGIPDWSSRKRLIKPGPVQIQGKAWSGNGTPVKRVEFAVNGQWRDAELSNNNNKYAWSTWHCDWQAVAGSHVLSCRATDANDNTQPIDAPWDAAGFGNNAIQQVEVWCEDYKDQA